jgi:hypothetical protein
MSGLMNPIMIYSACVWDTSDWRLDCPMICNTSAIMRWAHHTRVRRWAAAAIPGRLLLGNCGTGARYMTSASLGRKCILSIQWVCGLPASSCLRRCLFITCQQGKSAQKFNVLSIDALKCRKPNVRAITVGSQHGNTKMQAPALTVNVCTCCPTRQALLVRRYVCCLLFTPHLHCLGIIVEYAGIPTAIQEEEQQSMGSGYQRNQNQTMRSRARP